MSELKSKRGRPSIYHPDLAKEICDTLASTSKGTKKLCAENLHWPSQDTLFTWLKTNAEFSEQYARAKKNQAELLVDEILEISDDASQDQIITNQGEIIFNSQAINRARLKIDTRKWLACKLIPRVYGSKVEENEIDLNSRVREELLELRAKLDEKYTRDYYDGTINQL